MWRTIKSFVHKIRLHGRRGKGAAESFSWEKVRQAPQKEGGWEILCDPGWYIHKPDVQNKWEENTLTHTVVSLECSSYNNCSTVEYSINITSEGLPTAVYHHPHLHPNMSCDVLFEQWKGKWSPASKIVANQSIVGVKKLVPNYCGAVAILYPTLLYQVQYSPVPVAAS